MATTYDRYADSLRKKARNDIARRLDLGSLGAGAASYADNSRAIMEYRPPQPISPPKPSNFGEAVKAGALNVLNWEPVKFALKTLDTPGSFIRGGVSELVNPTPEKSVLSAAAENTSNLWSDKEVTYTQDILKENRRRQGAPPMPKDLNVTDAVVGFAGDVLLDPLLFLGVGAIGKTGKFTKATGGISARSGSAQRVRRVEQAAADAYHTPNTTFREWVNLTTKNYRGTKKSPIVPGTREARKVREAAEETIDNAAFAKATAARTEAAAAKAAPEAQDDLGRALSTLAPIDETSIARAADTPVDDALGIKGDPVAEIFGSSASKTDEAIGEVTETEIRKAVDEVKQTEGTVPEKLTPRTVAEANVMQEIIKRPEDFAIPSAFRKIEQPKTKTAMVKEVNKATTGTADDQIEWAYSLAPEDIEKVSGAGTFKRGDVQIKVSAQDAIKYARDEIEPNELMIRSMLDNYGGDRAAVEDILNTMSVESKRQLGEVVDKIYERTLSEIYKRHPAASSKAQTATPGLLAASESAERATEGWTRTVRGKNIPDGYEVLDAKSWDNLRKKLTRFQKNGWISKEDFDALKAARNSMDPTQWDAAVARIMYDGYPTPIQPEVRAIADATDLPTAPVEHFTENPISKLTPADQKVALNALRTTVRREFEDVAKYTRETRVPGTKVDPQELIGRNLFGFNRFSDYTLFKSVLDDQVRPLTAGAKGDQIQERFMVAARRLVEEGRLDPQVLKYGKDKWGFQARVREELVVPILRATSDFMESQGIIHNLGTAAHGKPVTLVDIIESLPAGRMRDMFFHPSTNTPVSNIEEAVDRILDRAIKYYDELGRMPSKQEWTHLAETIVGYKGRIEPDAKFVEEIKNILKKRPGYQQKGINRSSYDLSDAHVAFVNAKSKGGSKTKAEVADALAYERAKLLINGTLRIKSNGDNIFTRMAARAERYGKDVHAQTAEITKETQDLLIAALRDDAPFAVRAGALTHVDDAVKEIAAAKNAAPEAAMRANDQVDEFIAETVPEQTIKAVDDAVEGAKAISKGDQNEAVQKALEWHKRNVAEAQADLPISHIDDWDFNTYDALQSTFQRRTAPFFEHFAKNTYAMRDIGEAVARFRNVLRPQRAYYHNALAKTYQAHSTIIEGTKMSAFDNAFYNIQRGLTPDQVANPAIAAAMKDVNPLVDAFFNTQFSLLDAEQLSRFVDNGFDFDLLNRAFAADGHAYAFFDLKDAADAVKAGDFDNVAQALGSQWRGWDIQDPAEFLKVAEKVLTHQITLQSTVFQGLTYAEKLGHIRHKPTPGFVKYTNSSRDSIIERYIPKDTYIAKEIAPQFGQLDKVLAQTLYPTNQTRFGRFMRGPFGSIMALWKSGMTIWNPRHYFRNGVGDISLNFLAGVDNPNVYRLALKAMARRGDYGYWDGIAALKAAGEVMPKPGAPLFYIKVGKEKVPVSGEELYANLRARGVLNAYPVRENLLDDMVDMARYERYQQNLAFTGGKVKDKITKTHEWRDHFIRLAQGIDVMKKGRWNSLDDALEAAARDIRHWHPDGSDLSLAQNKYWRTAFPFYSWTRGAIPLVVESFLTKPHRIMMYPKAYYNIAEANGINLVSLANPFPVDQLFPDFITDRMTGPITEDSENHYVGIHPGVVQDDLSNFATNPIRAALGMLGPGIKAPVELATGQNLGIDAPVADVSDYIDSQIPGVNVLASLTGYSPSGTLGNMVSFNRYEDPTSGERSVFDPQRNVQRGLNKPFDIQDALNWLTGLQISDMSQENYINLAEIQARDKARREARRNA